MKKLLALILLLPTLAFGQTYWTNIQTVTVPQNLVDTFILGVTNPPPTNELITAQSMLNWIGLGPSNYTTAVSNTLLNEFNAGTNTVLIQVTNIVTVLSNTLASANFPYVWTNKDSGVNLTASGTFSTNLLVFTVPAGNTNLWELTISSPWVNVNSSYTVTAQVAVTPDGNPASSPWTTVLWTDAADSTFPANSPLIVRLDPSTTVTFQITGSGSGSINMRGRTTATAWIIDPQ